MSEKLLSAADITEFGLLLLIPMPIGPVDDGRSPAPIIPFTRASMLSLLL